MVFVGQVVGPMEKRNAYWWTGTMECRKHGVPQSGVDLVNDTDAVVVPNKRLSIHRVRRKSTHHFPCPVSVVFATVVRLRSVSLDGSGPCEGEASYTYEGHSQTVEIGMIVGLRRIFRRLNAAGDSLVLGTDYRYPLDLQACFIVCHVLQAGCRHGVLSYGLAHGIR